MSSFSSASGGGGDLSEAHLRSLLGLGDESPTQLEKWEVKAERERNMDNGAGCGDEHSHEKHDHDETFHIKTDKGVAVLSIFEDGIPPVFRVAFEGWSGAVPSAADVSVTTVRPNEGGASQVFAFALHEGGFLQSTVDIPEPHDFDATLSIKGAGDDNKIEFRESPEHAHLHGHAHSEHDSHDHSNCTGLSHEGHDHDDSHSHAHDHSH